MSEADAAYQQGYSRGMTRGAEAGHARAERAERFARAWKECARRAYLRRSALIADAYEAGARKERGEHLRGALSHLATVAAIADALPVDEEASRQFDKLMAQQPGETRPIKRGESEGG